MLLAGFGWRWLIADLPDLRPAFAKASAASLLVLLPAQLWLSHARYAPFAAVDHALDASGADYALIQRGNSVFSQVTVTNRPDLSNRPIRLDADAIADPARFAAAICRPGTVVAVGSDAFFRPGFAYFGAAPANTADARIAALTAPYAGAGCTIKVLR